MSLDTAEQRRHQYGTIITLAEFQSAHNNGQGICRGCRTLHEETPLHAKGQPCKACGKFRVFGPIWYAWNGWIEELPATSWRGRNIKRLLEQTETSGEAR